MIGRTVSLLAAVWCVLLAMAVVPAAAQVPCDTDLKSSTAGGASVVGAAGDSVQHKNWQAVGGEIEFTVRSFTPIPAASEIMVCFRWKARNPADPAAAEFFPTRPDRIDLSPDGKTLKVATQVPDLWSDEKFSSSRDSILGLDIVPIADVRILAIDAKANPQVVVASAMTSIGISRLWAAIIFTLIALALALMVLSLVSLRRLQGTPTANANLSLRVIATPKGYASLSQLQIVLWTFVVAASAVYVMSLSGELIDISSGTLVLLGISGAATVGSKWQSEAQDAAKPQAAAPPAAAAVAPPPPPAPAVAAPAPPAPPPAPPPPPAAPAAPAAAPAPQAQPAPQPHTPMWADLIINEVRDKDQNGQVRREIDVTRVQMLYFTLITSAFVVMRVVTTYVIPEIPYGFLTLMGISNGVYMGAKIAQKP